MTAHETEAIGRPYHFYKRFLPTGPTAYVVFQVDSRAHFVLHHIITKWEESPKANRPPFSMAFQFLAGGQGIPFSSDFEQGDLIATPASLGVASAIDATPSEYNLTATPLKIAPDVNYPFQFRELIEVKITGFEYLAHHAGHYWFPRILDLLLVGQYYLANAGEGK